MKKRWRSDVRMASAASPLVSNAVFEYVLYWIRAAPSTWVKSYSHLLFISKKGRAHDPGNWKYAALWLTFKHAVQKCPASHAYGYVRQLETRWPSTGGNSWFMEATPKGWERLGDVWECALGVWRHSGLVERRLV